MKIPFFAAARVALFVALMPLCPVTAWAQSGLSPSLPYGKNAVGYRDFVLRDLSRNIPGEDSLGNPIRTPRPRALHISVWYPAVADASAKRMTYGDYLDLFSLPLTLPVGGAAARDSANAALLRY